MQSISLELVFVVLLLLIWYGRHQRRCQHLHVFGVLIGGGKDGFISGSLPPLTPGLEEGTPAKVHEGGNAALGGLRQVAPRSPKVLRFVLSEAALAKISG